MKKALPYIIGAVLLILVLLLLRGRSNDTREVSTFVSLKREDKNPYGTYVVYSALEQLFPKAKMEINSKNMFTEDLIGTKDSNKLFVSIGPHFRFSRYEIDELFYFVEKGNTAFISCFQLNPDMETAIDARMTVPNLDSYPFGDGGPDGLHVELDSIPLPNNYQANYPGLAMEGFFARTNRQTTRIIGRGKDGRANFIQLKKGKGNLFIHLSPLAFGNYFLLYKNNIQYFNQVFSLVPANTKTIIWDEFYRKRRQQDGSNDNDNWFQSIMKQKSFRAGILLALLLLLIFALLEMRRRQRYIPVIEPLKNDSLDFVKTMGLLYYDKKDNRNLAQKMGAYFQEHVRNKYNIFSKELNDDYIKEVSEKSGADIKLVTLIVEQLKRINAGNPVSDEDLISFQTNIETFYKSI